MHTHAQWHAGPLFMGALYKHTHTRTRTHAQATWHAGPLFAGVPHMDFYNLELSDTNVVDHNTHDYGRAAGVQFQVVDAAQ